MILWNKLPADAQRVLLALAVAAGGTQAAGCLPRVCDPPPPPTTAPTPSRTRPPVICDPMPPPSVTRTPTITPTQTMTPTGTITPGSRTTLTPTRPPVICDPAPMPPVTPRPGGSSRYEGPASPEAAAQDVLPLAEIRCVEILWAGGLTFEASSPWPGAAYRWSVSGGLMEAEGDRIVWHAPSEPGLYLIQVAADWGRRGLAVDALALRVNEGGGVEFA